MKLAELCKYLDESIPLPLQEDYDNSGLQVGSPDQELTSALLVVDVTEEVIDEAVMHGCNLIISHHPLIFNRIKSITGKTVTERLVIRALKEGIAVYSAHTNLDAVNFGVSHKMAEKLGLRNVKVLAPIKGRLMKLVTFIPESHLEKVREALFEAGAGVIGSYDKCGFSVAGTGSFRAGEQANPFSGERGKIHFENEVRFETILFTHLRDRVIRALLSSHPYEEVAYDIYNLENNNSDVGLGCIGELAAPVTDNDLPGQLKSVFGSEGIRSSKLSGRKITKIAVCGGAGSSLIPDAIAGGADAFVTADIKYHSFLDAGTRLLLVDIGHFESEKFAAEIIHDLIIKNFPKFAVRFSDTNTNPINYF